MLGAHGHHDARDAADDEGGDDDAEEHYGHSVQLLGRRGGQYGRLETHRCRDRPVVSRQSQHSELEWVD